MNAIDGSLGGAANSLPLYEADTLEKEASRQYGKENWDKAAALYQRSLAIRKSCCGEKDPNNARLFDGLGLSFLGRHLPAQAEIAFQQAEELLQAGYYAGHGQLAPVLEHHADALIEQDRLLEAEQKLKRAQEIYAKTVTMENRDTLRSLLKLARLYLAIRQPEQAEAVLNKAMKHVDTPLGPIAEFRYQLALAYTQEGKIAESNRLFRLCTEQFKQRHNYARVVDCLEQLQMSDPQIPQAEIEKYRKLSESCRYPEDIFLATLLRA